MSKKILLAAIAISLALLLAIQPEVMGKSNMGASRLVAVMPAVYPLPTVQQNFVVGKPTRWRNLNIGRANTLNKTHDW